MVMQQLARDGTRKLMTGQNIPAVLQGRLETEVKKRKRN
jgi:hypothetical protein